ncbi:MAG TPA: VOC family protein [Candidatus Binatus sp.]|nr:VOC family protein [Candidatus Binatus sp.]
MEFQTTVAGQTIFPALRYINARAAIEWLQRAFDASTHVVYESSDGSVEHAEVIIAGNMIMLGQSREDGYPIRSPREVGVATAGIYVALPDASAVDALHQRAAGAGAKITQAPHDTDYGSHDFGAEDVEGNRWNFGTYSPS